MRLTLARGKITINFRKDPGGVYVFLWLRTWELDYSSAFA